MIVYLWASLLVFGCVAAMNIAAAFAGLTCDADGSGQDLLSSAIKASVFGAMSAWAFYLLLIA